MEMEKPQMKIDFNLLLLLEDKKSQRKYEIEAGKLIVLSRA